MIVLDRLPNRRVEDWKWTDLRAAVKGLAETDEGGALVGRRAPGFSDHLGDDVVMVVARGAIERVQLPAGVSVHLQRDAGGAAWAKDLAIDALNRPAVDETFVLEFRETVDRPIQLVTQVGAAERIAIVLRDGVKAMIIDTPTMPRSGLAHRVVDIGVQTDAQLDWVTAAPDGAGEFAGLTGVHLSENARFTQTTLTTGAHLGRFETHVHVSGPGADVTLNGVSLLAGRSHADHTTRVIHAAPGAVTRETFRTVAADQGRGVFQGKIKVERAGQHTDAEMNHAGLILGEGALVNAKPELEIYADDVACAHGATVGALDADALFYLRQRGVPAARAKALLTRAFIAEALEAVAHDGARAGLDAMVDAWMEAHLS